MSSFATAAARGPKDDNGNGKQQLHLLGNPDAPRMAAGEESHAEASMAAAAGAAPSPAPSVHPQNLEEVARVERLLTQLEARSMALVPYGYGSLREVGQRKSNTGLIAAVIVGIWVSSIVLFVAYLKYSNHAAAGAPAVTVTSPPVITPEPDPHDRQVAQSVDNSARALAERMAALQAAMEKQSKDMQKLTVPKGSGSVGVRVTSSVGASSLGSGVRGDELQTGTNEATLPKNWHNILDVKPSNAAVPHKAADGNIDYWLVPRNGEPSKVLPIGTTPDGVVVHSLEDGKDYTLTPSGEWRSGAIAPSGN